MHFVMIFTTVLAVLGGLVGTLTFVVRFITAWNYTTFDRFRDLRYGFTPNHDIRWPFLLAVVCWAWVIAYAFA